MAWLSGWAARNRLQFTVEASLISSDLTDFPLLVKLSTSSGTESDDLSVVFDELTSDANRKKIAVTESDGTTELYVEIQKWDDANETALLWVKCDLSSSVDSVFYLYYDSSHADNTTYVGDIGDSAAQNVWDSSFEAVWHLTEQGNGTANEYVDSTGNGHHGTADEGSGTEPTLGTAGPLGVSQSFDGGDIIKFSLTGFKGEKTVETLIYDPNKGDYILHNGAAASANHGFALVCDASTGFGKIDSAKGTSTVWRYRCGGAVALDNTTWRHYAHRWDNTTDTNKANNWLNGGTDGSNTASHTETTDPSSPTTEIGGFWYASSYTKRLTGSVGETRLSTTYRSTAWIDATYETIWDNLVKYSAWHSDYDNRFRINIDSANIDSTLTDYPVMLSLSASSGILNGDLTAIFDELGSDANRKKIAVTLEDGVTECYVEIERWDTTNEKAVLWTKVASISSTDDTVIYLYYDSTASDNTTYVGDTGDSAAQSVWDNDFEMVIHHAQDPSGGSGALKDSTSNGANFTSVGTMLTEDLVEGPENAYALEYDGGDDGLETTLGPNPNGYTEITIESFFNATNLPGSGVYGHLVTGEGTPSADAAALLRIDNNVLDGWVYTSGPQNNTHSTTLSTGTWYYGALQYKNGETIDVFLDDSKDTGSTASAAIGRGTGGYWDIGNWIGVATREFDGKIGEARVSSSRRTDEWLKATYYTLNDTLVAYEADTAPAGTWVGTYAQRREFVISSTLVDSDLTDFPVALAINSSCGIGGDDLTGIFSEISTADRKKIAVTSSDGGTQLYVEIENWDSTSNKALIHTKVPSISSTVNTTIYLYYDSSQENNTSYVGDVGDTPARNVWDSSYDRVLHMTDSTTLKNSVDGSTETLGGTLSETTSPKGLALSSDSSSDLVDCASHAFGLTFTIEAQINKSSTSPATYPQVFGKHDYITLSAFNASSWKVYLGNGSSWDASMDASSTLSEDQWYVLGFSYSSGTYACYLDGSTDGSGSGTSRAVTTDFEIFYRQGSSTDYRWQGAIGEFRISTSARAGAWIKATHKSLLDAFGTWGSKETPGGVEEAGVPYPKVVINGRLMQVEDARVMVGGRWMVAEKFSIVNSGRWFDATE